MEAKLRDQNSFSEKIERIKAACQSRDLKALIDLATSEYGLIDDEQRQTAWPILLGCTDQSLKELRPWEELPVHHDEGQVKLDVDRAFVYYPRNEPEKKLDHRRRDLSDLIISTIRRHPALNYFQGYHDIVQVFLLVLGPQQAALPVARLSLLRIRDFMLPTLSATTVHLDLLPAILHVADAEVERHLSQTRPFFALSATLTLYAHDIEAYGDIARLFDFLLATDAAMSIYLFAVIIVSRKDRLLEIEEDEPEMLHSVLSKLPKPLDLEHLISSTTSLYRKHPPQALPRRAWHQVSPYSVLKTTRNHEQLARQTLQEGEKLFAKQASQLRMLHRYEQMKLKLWRMRKPARTAGLTVMVVVLSWWLQRNGTLGQALSLWQKIAGTFQSA